MKSALSISALTLALALSACQGKPGDSSSGATMPAGPTALQVTDTAVGTGATASAGQTVTVNYTGWLYNPTASDLHGKQFDSSVGKAPFSFKLGAGMVIAGWDQGVAGMKVGGARTLVIPSALGYGSAGAGGVIPPDAVLVFNVELLSAQ